MITTIGIVAGDILSLLEEANGPLVIKDLVKSIAASEDIILMSVGWLVREGLIKCDQYDNHFFVWVEKPVSKKEHLKASLMVAVLGL